MFHYLLEDMPHGLVGIAQLTKEGEHSCGSDGHGTFTMPIDAEVLTWLQVIFSLGSVLFGVVVRSIQLLVLRAANSESVRVGGEGGLRTSLLLQGAPASCTTALNYSQSQPNMSPAKINH